MFSRGSVLVLAVALGLGLVLALPHATAQARQRGGCRAQKPQTFLKRSHYVKNQMIDGKAHAQAIHYRAEHYGSIPGIAATEFNPKRVANQVVHMRFFGLPIVIHEKVAVPLGCVERRIIQECTGPKSQYEPRAIGGLRTENTSHHGEISNHLFGIAIDIDPERNPCCHCTKKWQENRKCKQASSSPYDRAELPRCWVSAFEHYGFYWLGKDSLEDTMHFEYLGNPRKFE
jgi:hypothetical protein